MFSYYDLRFFQLDNYNGYLLFADQMNGINIYDL